VTYRRANTEITSGHPWCWLVLCKTHRIDERSL